MPLGLVRNGTTILLAPADSVQIRPTDNILVIANDANDALHEAQAAVNPRRITLPDDVEFPEGTNNTLSGSTKRITDPASAFDSAAKRSDVRTSQSRIVRWLRRPRRGHAVANVPSGEASHLPTDASTAALRSILPTGMPRLPKWLSPGKTILIIGWQRGFENVLRILDSKLPNNSEIYIVSEQNEHFRATELANEAIPLHGKLKKKRPDSATATATGERANAGGIGVEEDDDEKWRPLKNVELIHMVGFITVRPWPPARARPPARVCAAACRRQRTARVPTGAPPISRKSPPARRKRSPSAVSRPPPGGSGGSALPEARP